MATNSRYVLAAVLLWSTASARDVYPLAVADQRLVYDAGTAWILSPAPVFMAASFEVADRSSMWVGLIVRNDTDAPVTVREQDISAKYGNVDQRIWTSSELMAQQHRKDTWRKIAGGLAADLNSYSAGQQGRYTTNGTFDGNVQAYGSSGYANSRISGSYSATGIDPIAQQNAIQAAALQNQQMVQRIKAQGEMDEQFISSFVFRSQTLSPGQIATGHLKVEMPGGSSPAKPVVVLVKTSAGTTVPFFVGVDGRYDEPERQRAAQLYQDLNPSPQSASTGSAPAPASTQSIVSDASIGPASSNASSLAAQASEEPIRSRTVDAHVAHADAPGKAHNLYPDGEWPVREIGDKKKIVAKNQVKSQEDELRPDSESPEQKPLPSTEVEATDVKLEVVGKALSPCQMDVASTCVIIDISWQAANAIQIVTARTGRLILASTEDRTKAVAIGWSVPSGLTIGKKIEERGIEFPLGNAGLSKTWLSTAQPAAMRANFMYSASK